jgi:hypothetical protein
VYVVLSEKHKHIPLLNAIWAKVEWIGGDRVWRVKIEW